MVLSFILFFIVLLVDIRNLKRIKQLQVEKNIFLRIYKHIVRSQ
jgi:hypothetical protein